MNTVKRKKLSVIITLTLMLIMLVIHHYITHSYFFDFHNLFSHEALETLIIGIIIGFSISLKK